MWVLLGRCYCFECVDALVGPGTSEAVQAMSRWACFLCLPFAHSGLLRRRAKWRARLKAFYDREAVSGAAGHRGMWGQRPHTGCGVHTRLRVFRDAPKAPEWGSLGHGCAPWGLGNAS